MATKKLKGQQEDANGKCQCQRCGKRIGQINFYTYKDGSKCEICKPCLTARIDNFDPTTFEWILEKMDVPYVPTEWNVLRDRAFAKDPYKMNGMSVIGKYLAKMKLKQWSKYGYADTKKIQEEMEAEKAKKEKAEADEKARYEAELKVKLSQGKISPAQYQTLVSTETQNKELLRWGDVITGQHLGQIFQTNGQPQSYEEALKQAKNPFQEQNFMSESDIIDPGADLDKEDKMYLAVKWGRLYKPSQWVALEQLYNEFMDSFDIQGAARIDTLKMICKTSLKMNEAIDCGDIDSYQKLSRVYDSMMKSAKFTEAQNKDKDGDAIDSASAIVDFVEAHTGEIPRYECKEPQDIVDQIIADLKAYNKSLIYEDKSLAQEIEKYLQDKRISEEMKKDKKDARAKGLENVELEDDDFTDYKNSLNHMKSHDKDLNDELIQEEYINRRVQHE